MENVRVECVPMPVSVKAYTILQDDFYTIVLNANCSMEENLKSFHHEARHIASGDFEKEYSVDKIEYSAHNFNLFGE